MLLKKIRLVDFLSHKDTTIEFPSGVTVIIGPNGAGKTAILDGIIFALFGEKTRGEKLDDLIRAGARSAKVELYINVGGIKYRIFRKREKGSTDVEIVKTSKEGARVISSKKDVSKEISAIFESMGFDRKTYKDTVLNSIFVRQGEITSLIDSPPSQRKKIIGNLLGIGKIEKAWENMLEVIKCFKEYLEKCKIKISSHKKYLEEIERNVKKYRDDIEKLEEKIKEAKQELIEKQKQLEEAKKNYEIYEEKRKKYSDLSAKKARLEGEKKTLLKSLKEHREELNKITDAENKIKELELYIGKIGHIEKYAELSRNLEEISRDIKIIEKNLDRATELKEKLENLLGQIEKLEVVPPEKIEEISIAQIDEKITSIDRTYSSLSTSLSEVSKRIRELKLERDREVEKAKKVLPIITKEEYEKLGLKLAEEKNKLNDKISQLKREEGSITEAIETLRQNIAKLRDASECPLCRTKLTSQHREQVCSMLADEIEKLEKKQKEIDNKLCEAKKSLQEIEEKIKQLDRIDIDRIYELEEKIKEKEKEARDIIKDLSLALKESACYVNILEALMKKYRGNVEEINKKLIEIQSKIGYAPENPERELKELRKKEREYYRLKTLVDKKPEVMEKIEKCENDIKEIDGELAMIKKQMEALDYSEEKYKEIKNKYEELQKKCSELTVKIRENEKQFVAFKEELEKQQTKLKNAREKQKKLEEIREKLLEFIDKLETIRKALSKDRAQKMLRQEFAPYISKYAREYIEEFNLDITDIEVDEDFNIKIMKSSGIISKDSLSGGEKVAVAIAIRLAIAKVLAGTIYTIIMDEPTMHLDEERRKELVEIINNLSKGTETIPQMIIVTHQKELEETADTLYIINKVNNISVIKQPNKII